MTKDILIPSLALQISWIGDCWTFPSILKACREDSLKRITPIELTSFHLSFTLCEFLTYTAY